MMRSLWRQANVIKKLIAQANRIFLFLDFDGTLAPIAETPPQAQLPPSTRGLLRALLKNTKITVTIISGRPLRDLKRKIGIKGITYAGVHGLEWESGGKRVQADIPKAQLQALKRLKRILKGVAARYSGSLLEDKRLALAFHYRLVTAGSRRSLKAEVFKRGGKFLAGGSLRLIPGKAVWEFRPAAGWTKGQFCQNFLKNRQRPNFRTLPIYLGDDTADEAAFAELHRAITIRVGKNGHSSANYYLKNTGDVFRFLNWIKGILVKTYYFGDLLL